MQASGRTFQRKLLVLASETQLEVQFNGAYEIVTAIVMKICKHSFQTCSFLESLLALQPFGSKSEQPRLFAYVNRSIRLKYLSAGVCNKTGEARITI